jgi:hypothetical protein
MIVILYDRTPGGVGFVKTIGNEFAIARLLGTARSNTRSNDERVNN